MTVAVNGGPFGWLLVQVGHHKQAHSHRGRSPRTGTSALAVTLPYTDRTSADPRTISGLSTWNGTSLKARAESTRWASRAWKRNATIHLVSAAGHPPDRSSSHRSATSDRAAEGRDAEVVGCL